MTDPTPRDPPGRSRRLLVTTILTLATALSGCGPPAPVKPDLFYSLAPVPLEGPAGPPLRATLLVNDLAARGFLGGRQIIFRTTEEPLVVQRYQGLLWEEPVTRAMARNLVGAIRAAQIFEFVLIPADRGRADYLLGGEVERFEHLPTAQPPRVLGTLNLTLVRADDRRSLWDRRYSGEVLTRGAAPEDMAEAFNQLAASLASEVVGDLRTLQRRPGPGGAP